jgi:hypothetical protein
VMDPMVEPINHVAHATRLLDGVVLQSEPHGPLFLHSSVTDEAWLVGQ